MAMARGGIYRTDVEKARKELLVKGKNPTVESVRFVLGRGSNTTILKHLQEINAEAAGEDRPKPAISDALAETVQRLAEQLQADADQRIAQIQSACDDAIAEQQAQVAQAHLDRDGFASQLQRSELALQAERATHTTCQQGLTEAQTLNRQLEERVAGLLARVAEHEAHALSLEEKHKHAREALEHYRTSVKEQRDQEQRRHEHQVQELQVALRQANDAVTAKNHDLLHLNRDNVRLVEQGTQLEKELRQLRSEAREHEHELSALRPRAAACDAAETRWAQTHAMAEALKQELAAAQGDLAREGVARHQAETSAAHATGRLEALEKVIAQLGPLGQFVAVSPAATGISP
jgi:chromosome segregation ATPase